jgi:hypothetical protein
MSYPYQDSGNGFGNYDNSANNQQDGASYSIQSGLNQLSGQYFTTSHNASATNSTAGISNQYAFGSTGIASNYSQSQVSQIANDLLGLSRISGQMSSQINTEASSSGGNGSAYLSPVEAAILRSTVPIDLAETEEINVLGQRGIWANKQETVNWKGIIPISQYAINEDASPEIITKRTTQNLTYIQELAVRYLRPPTPPTPGEIVITQELNTVTPPAPPLVIRQQPARPSTPEPLVIREAPPQPPTQVGRKVITISGKKLPPPPRKVVIERLPPLPSKPQSVMIERWLPYNQVKRRVIFQKTNQSDPVVVKPRNVIIQWEAPQVTVKKDYKYLGIFFRLGFLVYFFN